MEKIWITREKHLTPSQNELLDQVSREYGIVRQIALVILERVEWDIEALAYYLSDKPALFDPALLKDMDKAVALIKEAMKNNHRIRIVGDYDVDGVTSTYIMLIMFEMLEYTHVDHYLPLRELDGYGLNESIVDQAYEDGVKLIITVDNGVSAVAPIAKAREYGIDVIVTDHHELPEVLPNATAIINPHQEACQYPYKGLTGGGIAYKVAAEFSKECRARWGKGYAQKIISLAAISTIADMGTLLGENRAIVKHGIPQLHNNTLPAVSYIVGVPQRISPGTIGFQIGPRLNACGRLADAETALEYLQCIDLEMLYTQKERLDELNKVRQEEQARCTQIIRDRLYSMEKLPDIIVEYCEDAHESICGLIASNIVKEFYRPTIVFTKTIHGNYKGSGRSIMEYNLFESIKPHMHVLDKAGGHPMACGCSASSIAQFEQLASILNAESTLTEEDKLPKLMIDNEISIHDDLKAIYDSMKLLEPCGYGNSSLSFLMRNVRMQIGMSKKRNGDLMARIRLYKSEYQSFNCVCWEPKETWALVGEDIFVGDVLCKLEEYQGEIQINILDIKSNRIK